MNTAQRKRLDTIQEILRAVHFPERWITDQTAICLCALVNRTPRSGLLPGKACLRDGARIRNILDFARRDLRKPVAENTRESYRKQSLKPLYEAGIIELHQTSINDPNTFYTINADLAHPRRNPTNPVCKVDQTVECDPSRKIDHAQKQARSGRRDDQDRRTLACVKSWNT